MATKLAEQDNEQDCNNYSLTFYIFFLKTVLVLYQ